jgi:hypothetical protein
MRGNYMSDLNLLRPKKKKVSTTFWADPEIKERMKKAAKEDKLSYAEAVHNGCILYLKSRQENYLDDEFVNSGVDIFGDEE